MSRLLRRLTSARRPNLDDLPPAYGAEDPLQILRQYDIVFLVDDSGSMSGARWKEAGDALASVADKAAIYDPNGIDIHFLNSPESAQEVTSKEEVVDLFNAVRPYGPTPTGDRLDHLLGEYITQIEDAKTKGLKKMPKPVNFIVITDGVPTDDPESVIIAAARRLDAGNFLLSQVGIQFIQVGNDSKATKALKELDDGINKTHKIRDMVDTTPYKGKALDGATVNNVIAKGPTRAKAVPAQQIDVNADIGSERFDLYKVTFTGTLFQARPSSLDKTRILVDMGQNSSSPNRRSTLRGGNTNRRRSTGGSMSAPPQRRATMPAPAPATINTAHRANNMASPPPYSYSASAEMPKPIPEFEPPVVNNISSGLENALELLKEYDTVFLIDDSGSMAGSLWREAGKALEGVARVAAQYDDDGIDLHFLNCRESMLGVTSEQQVRDLFTRLQPRGQTPTGARLDSLLRPYISSIEQAYQDTGSTDPSVTGIKPINFIVITDGAPTDEPEDVIVAAARRLDQGNFPLSQLGVQFVQIGNDPEAKTALEELDDDLSGKYGIRDIVDTTPYTQGGLNGETLIKILLGGINKRVDKRGGASVMR
ncbi:hypothetical protein FRC09_015811 [Ceratobasidium sp. 395]|nr:hypothetical protein FRC09_015811 [Ceratobasidium sp. 395]